MGGIPERQRVHASCLATSLKWPEETALAVVVGQRDGVAQAFTLKKMHIGKGMHAGGVYLVL